jgi:hypothetical protein
MKTYIKIIKTKIKSNSIIFFLLLIITILNTLDFTNSQITTKLDNYELSLNENGKIEFNYFSRKFELNLDKIKEIFFGNLENNETNKIITVYDFEGNSTKFKSSDFGDSKEDNLNCISLFSNFMNDKNNFLINLRLFLFKENSIDHLKREEKIIKKGTLKISMDFKFDNFPNTENKNFIELFFDINSGNNSSGSLIEKDDNYITLFFGDSIIEVIPEKIKNQFELNRPEEKNIHKGFKISMTKTKIFLLEFYVNLNLLTEEDEGKIQSKKHKDNSSEVTTYLIGGKSIMSTDNFNFEFGAIGLYEVNARDIYSSSSNGLQGILFNHKEFNINLNKRDLENSFEYEIYSIYNYLENKGSFSQTIKSFKNNLQFENFSNLFLQENSNLATISSKFIPIETEDLLLEYIIKDHPFCKWKNDKDLSEICRISGETIFMDVDLFINLNKKNTKKNEKQIFIYTNIINENEESSIENVWLNGKNSQNCYEGKPCFIKIRITTFTKNIKLQVLIKYNDPYPQIVKNNFEFGTLNFNKRGGLIEFNFNSNSYSNKKDIITANYKSKSNSINISNENNIFSLWPNSFLQKNHQENVIWDKNTIENFNFYEFNLSAKANEKNKINKFIVEGIDIKKLFDVSIEYTFKEIQQRDINSKEFLQESFIRLFIRTTIKNKCKTQNMLCFNKNTEKFVINYLMKKTIFDERENKNSINVDFLDKNGNSLKINSTKFSENIDLFSYNKEFFDLNPDFVDSYHIDFYKNYNYMIDFNYTNLIIFVLICLFFSIGAYLYSTRNKNRYYSSSLEFSKKNDSSNFDKVPTDDY